MTCPFRSFLIILFVFCAPATLSDVHNYPSRILTKKDGLPSNNVRNTFEDKDGFIWFGTNNGLARFDGYNFKTFKHSQESHESIASNTINDIFQDSRGNIWLGTNNGLSRFDKHSNTFKNIHHDKQLSGSNNAIYEIHELANKEFLLKTYSGLSTYKPNIKDVLTPIFNYTSDQQKSSKYLTAATYDNKSHLWFTNGKEVMSLDVKTAEVKKIKRCTEATEIVNIHFHHEKIYIVTSKGLYLFDLKTNNCSKIKKVIKQSQSKLPAEAIYFASFYQTEFVFIATPEHLYKLNITGEVLTKLKLPEVVVNQNILNITEDQFSNIWISTDNGVMVFSHNSQHLNSLFLNSDILSILEVSNEEVWLSHTKGIAVLNLSTRSVEPICIKSDCEEIFFSNLFLSKDGFIYAGSRGGVYKFTKNKKLIQTMLQNPSFFQVGRTFKDANENELFIGTLRSGLLRYNKKSNAYKQFVVENGLSESIGGNSITSLHRDEQSRMWIGTFDGGLSLYNPNKESFTRYQNIPNNPTSLSSNVIAAIHQSSPQYLWLTTWNGLNRLDIKSESFTSFSEKEGFPSNITGGLLADDKNLWISSGRGIIKFATDTHDVELYGSTDGLAKDDMFNIAAYHKGKFTKNMYFGGDGLLYFKPSKLKKSTKAANTYITQLTLNGQLVEQGDELLPVPLHESEQVIIPSNTKEFSFEFATLDFLAPQHNKYHYKLEGFHEKWIATDAKNRRASFSNLWPGEYTFRVKGSNKDGLWDSQGNSLKIVLLPPWYLTWWAYTCYVVIFLSSLYGLIKWYTWRLRRKAQNLEMLVAKRTQTIASLLKQKNRLFTHVSHEFRTPLTIILSSLKSFKEVTSDSKLATKLKVSESQCNQVISMLDNLLEIEKFAVINNKSRSIEDQPACHLQSLVNQVIDSIQPLAIDKELKLSVKVDSSLSVAVEREDMLKVLVNLLSNSIKYTLQGGTINVSGDVERHQIKIQVADNGIGIAVENQSTIFEQFFRVQDIEAKGAGLGLTLVKELVESYNGSIHLQSTLNQGSIFSVYLPISLKEANHNPINKEELYKELTTLVHGKECESPQKIAKESQNTLLIVEDNQFMMQLLLEIFSSEYSCLSAQNGLEGIRIATTEIPDIILSDVMMPKINGFELVESLKNNQLTSHIPVLLLTARGDQQSRNMGLTIQANDYLAKPFDEVELKLRVSNLISARDAIRCHLSYKLNNKEQPSYIQGANIELNDREQAFIDKLDKVLESFFKDPELNLAMLADNMNVSPRQLQRKVKAMFNCTPNRYLRIYRLKVASRLLTNSGAQVSEIAYSVGFSDYSLFRRYFKEYFNCSPSVYRSNVSPDDYEKQYFTGS